MRIIAGEMRSRTIVAPKGMDTRPTLDRTRESLFNILQGQCEGARVLDLYAGSGALGLEAISRGAKSAVLCDMSRDAAKAIETNISALRVQNQVRFLCMSDMLALKKLGNEGAGFNLVFLDPPYRMDTAPACKMMKECGVLENGAQIIIEHLDTVTPEPGNGFVLTDRRKYRDTAISFYRYEVSDNGKGLGIPGQL